MRLAVGGGDVAHLPIVSLAVFELDTGGQRNLGPDIYFESGDWAAQAPWTPGCALAFAPSARSWHGFEPRMIREVRKSLIIDYAPPGRAAAHELAFPERPVGWDA